MSVTSSKMRQQMKRIEPSILTVGLGVIGQGWMRIDDGAECDRLEVVVAQCWEQK